MRIYISRGVSLSNTYWVSLKTLIFCRHCGLWAAISSY